MATKFSDLGIQVNNDKKIFNCKEISISDIINLEIEILSYTVVDTQYGKDRYLIHCKNGDVESKFFTSSEVIKNILKQIPEDKFPIATTIRSVKFGNKKTYAFT